MALLEVQHLQKIYTTRFGGNPVQALSNVNFSVEPGEYVAIMGESGSGKTTLLNILAALDRPTAGEVFLNGKALSQIRERDLAAFRRSHLGFVFQDFNLLDTFSLQDNIFLPLVLAGEDYPTMQKKLRPIADQLGIGDILAKYPYEVSGGQKQRAAVARALITDPHIILADEPTGALDSRASDNLLDLFEQVNAAGQTILMVTHSVKAASHAGRVLFLRDGEVYHQLYRGSESRESQFRRISDTLTVLAEEAAPMRKSGFFPRLALVNLLRNGRYYGPYLVSCGGTAAMFYILRYLTESDIVASVRGAAYLQSLMFLGCIVVALFSAVLLLYANSFVMKRRQRELGLYNILGLEKRHIALLCLWETVYCALAAVLGGLAAGILLSKLTLLLLLQLSRLPVQFGFEISVGGMADTALLFAALFALTLVWNLVGIGRARPVELLHSASTGEREPKTRRLLVVLGLMTLGGGYILSWKVRHPTEALVFFFLAVVLVMIGTYCLFTAGSVAVLKALRANPGYYYQTRHFTAVAGLLHRMKQNAVGLANICILSTMVLVTVSSTVTLYQSCEETLDQMFPYDIQVVQYLTGYGEDVELPPSQQVLEQAEEITSASGCTASHFGWLNLVEGRCWYSGNTLQWVEGSEVRLRLITEADYLRCTGQKTDLAEDQVLAYTAGIDLPDTFYIGSLPFHVAQHLEADLPVNGSAFVSSEVALVTLVVADRATLEAVMAQPSGDHFSEEFLVQINLDSSEEAKLALSEALLNGISGEGIAVNSRQDNEATLYTMYGGFLFLGVFLGLLFLLATALIIYYKQISEGYEDQRRYAILRQVGMTDREVRASIHSQILLVFFLPLGTAGIHTAAAYPMVSKLLELFQLTNTARYALCAAGTFAVFGGVYVLVYGLTARTYHRIVTGTISS